MMNDILTALNSNKALLAILILLMIYVIQNPSFLSEISKLSDRYSKSKEILIKHSTGNLRLVSLQSNVRKIPVLTILRVISTILDCIILIGAVLLSLLVFKDTTKASLGTWIFLASLFILSLYSLFDNWIRIRKRIKENKSSVFCSVDIVLEGEYEKLLLLCQESLLEMNAFLLKYESTDTTCTINANYRNSVIKINVVKQDNLRNKITISSDSRLLSVISDSGQNLKNVRNLIRILCSTSIHPSTIRIETP